MKSQRIISALAALAMTIGSAATIAQPRDHDRGNERGRDRGSERGHDMRRGGDHDRGDRDRGRSFSRDRDDRGDRRGRDGDRWRETRDSERWRETRDERRWRDARDDRRWEERRAEQRREWRRGARLAPEYRTRHYVVDNWRGHRLRQPPRGYHWVQQGPDYLLVAIATGVIADLILNH